MDDIIKRNPIRSLIIAILTRSARFISLSRRASPSASG